MSLILQDTTYAGTFSNNFILPATFDIDSIKKGCFWVKDGIRKAHTVGRLTASNMLQPRKATPISSGSLIVDGRVLDPLDVMIYTEFNPRLMEDHFTSESMTNTLISRQLPPSLENSAIALTLAIAMQSLELGFHQGSLAYSRITDLSDPLSQIQYFDGIIRKLIVDGTFLAVASPAVLTTSNIIDKFAAAYNLVPKGLLGAEKYNKLKFMVSYEDQRIYEDALTTTAYKNNNTTDKGINQYKSFQVVPLAGLPKDTFYLAEAMADPQSNLWIGMNSTEDNQLELARLQANSEFYFLKGLMKFDVQVAFPNQFIMHTTKVASDFL